ncbi:molybdenum cofactor biosysynthesis protein [Aeromicrobium fastidiosum]|uniref:molybdenum cofactor biosysynthesis protein n=1 Tax=Aeromicrobium fastidiosum TaxID=52699 RepID=UPI00202320EE|nr:molybdenum cofactor biosysynthesis protein [Aeromicrobium fastidiosum]MCL8253235.1 molybdenum cofactor biosysynthesis protein [Aeromicrobium fastidiosum]
MEIAITHLVVSPVRRMDGRPRDGMTPYDGDETPTTVRVRAHKGLVGDRYFNTRFTYASVTIIAAEAIERLEEQIAGDGLFPAANTPFDPVLARRNLVTRGLDVDALVRSTFTLDGGHGPIRFRSITPANPCGWMNEVFAPGAHQALRGHGGIRCEPLDDGQLSVGPARVTDVVPIPQDELTRQVRRAPVG